MGRLHTAVRACALLAIVGAASTASADLTPEVFTFKATVGQASGSFTVMTDDGWFDADGNFYWTQDETVDILSDGGDVLATLTNSSITILHDPVINLNFNLQASNQNTIFEIDSGLLSFPEIVDAIGWASAGVTVTDVNGDGATISPDGSSMYLSQYNGELPTGTDFAALLPDALSADPFNTASASDEFPGNGDFANIADPVNDMSAAWTFSLSAFDIASGTSTFFVVPAPASAALLGLGGLALTRRRR